MRLMRLVPLLLVVLFVWTLNHSFSVSLPAFGKILDPVNGILASAEPLHPDFKKEVRLIGLQQPVHIWMDSALIAHVRATNDHDLYYAQGFLHANFRLWQMDLQTRAAAGRVSEVIGAKALDYDRGIRREGMVWGAQHSLAAMEKDPRTKAMLDAYRDGVNAYIQSLKSAGDGFRLLPLEYKLMGFYPEAWTNLKTALLMKYMARDLSGKTDDIAFTLLRDKLGVQAFDALFPERIKGNQPVIPEGTKFESPSLPPARMPTGAIWAHFGKEEISFWHMKGKNQSPAFAESDAPDPLHEVAVGSNNWAVSGAHTQSGRPILCNDPHLGLNLPSLWFEMQLTAPNINCYGASLPGAPGIVIGFNEKISWGFTNNYRDVKDFYEITPVQPLSVSAGNPVVWQRPAAYRFQGKEVPFEQHIEVIRVRGRADVKDTVLYTLQGPVCFDPGFRKTSLDAEPPGHSLIACTWMAHRGTNELLAVYLLNRAQDYPQFQAAIAHFECPAQNIAYADGSGNIALWGQGQFINKWKEQGKFVMRGDDSSTLWGADIPVSENPHVLNPPQGYVISANQQVTDSSYPYWYNGDFSEWRSWLIHEKLKDILGQETSRKLSMEQMMRLQNDTYSKLFEETAHSFVAKSSSAFRDQFSGWNGRLEANSTVATRFQLFWDRLYRDIWQDDFPEKIRYPSTEQTLQILLSDSTSAYYDDQSTPQKESLQDIVKRALRESKDSLKKLGQASETKSLEWYAVKNTGLRHLAKIPAFSYEYLPIGGWSNTINACRGNHGPSWRMIVEMDDWPKAYSIYPGGQSGNPGSPFYSDFIEQWVKGTYHTVQFLRADKMDNPLPYTWTLSP
ncbi:MAG: penicillin acylase family protein [Bacteroidetes bacterium]|nr:penicillin acylase family protein [Bacteroidota bacterium]